MQVLPSFSFCGEVGPLSAGEQPQSFSGLLTSSHRSSGLSRLPVVREVNWRRIPSTLLFGISKRLGSVRRTPTDGICLIRLHAKNRNCHAADFHWIGLLVVFPSCPKRHILCKGMFRFGQEFHWVEKPFAIVFGGLRNDY